MSAWLISPRPRHIPTLPSCRHGYYLALLECLNAACTPRTGAVLSWRHGHEEPSVAEAVQRVKTQASHFVRIYSSSTQPAAPSPGGGRRGGTAASAAAATGRV